LREKIVCELPSFKRPVRDIDNRLKYLKAKWVETKNDVRFKSGLGGD
jgi:hypothetical protein